MYIKKKNVKGLVLGGLAYGGFAALLFFVYEIIRPMDKPKDHGLFLIVPIAFGLVIGALRVAVELIAEALVKRGIVRLGKEVSGSRTVVCQGEAEYDRTKDDRMIGCAFLTEDSFDFYFHDYGVKKSRREDFYEGKFGVLRKGTWVKVYSVKLDDVVSTSVSLDGEWLNVKDRNRMSSFLVYEPGVWRRQIDRTIAERKDRSREAE